MWPPHDLDDTASAIKRIQVRTRRSPMENDILTMLAAAVLALHDLNLSFLLTDLLVRSVYSLPPASFECLLRA